MMAMFNRGGVSPSGGIESLPYRPGTFGITDAFTDVVASKYTTPWSLVLAQQYAKEIRVTYSVTSGHGSISGTQVVSRTEGDVTNLSQLLQDESGIYFPNVVEVLNLDDDDRSGNLRFVSSQSELTQWGTATSKWQIRFGAGCSLSLNYFDPDEEDDNRIVSSARGATGTWSLSSFTASFGPYSFPVYYRSDLDGDISGSCVWEVTSWLDWA